MCDSKLLLFSLTTLACVATASGALLSETFEEGKLAVQDLPNSAQWFNSESGGIKSGPTGLEVQPNRYVLAYFTEAGNPVELEVGQSLSVRVSFSVTDPINRPSVFRVAVLNSGDETNRVFRTGAGQERPEFMDYVGYGAFLNLNWRTALSLTRRDRDLSEKLINGNEPFEVLLGDTGRGATFSSDTPQTLTMTITRQSEGVEVSASVEEFDDYAGTIVDTSQALTTFDTVVIYGARSGMNGFSIQDVTVNVEPSNR